MAGPVDFGYMEGDQLGKPYDLALLLRLASFVRPHLRLVAFAALMTMFTTGIDLLLPYLTRVGIDRYIVRRAIALEVARISPRERRDLEHAAGRGLLPGKGVLFVTEEAWRRLPPRLAQRLRAAGAVSKVPWHLAPPGEASGAVAARHPGKFRAAGGRWLLPADHLANLPAADLARLRRPDALGVAYIALLFLAAALLGFGLNYGQAIFMERAGQEMMFDLRQHAWRRVLRRALAFFARWPVGKLVTRLTNDVSNLNELYRSTLVAVLQDLFLLAGIVVVLLWLDLELALWCLALMPLISGLAWLFSRLARNAFRDLQGWLGRINARLSETLAGLAVVKLFRAEEAGSAQFRRLNQRYFQAGMRQIRVFAVFMPLTDFMSSLAVALIIWYGGGQVVAERMSLGTLVAFVTYMQMFFRPMRDLAEKYNILQSAMASAERIFLLVDQEESLPLIPATRPGAALRGEVRFEGVSFGYDPAQPVLRDVSFILPPGETWAVVGPTGAGKTSLVNLLLRFYDPDQGRVLLSGQNLLGLGREEVARQVALVDQEVFLLAGSVQENITLGRPEVDPERLKRALEVSGAAGFVAALEQGLDTPLGEGASRLSGGQRQLLALARALAGDPAVLVLDEATSAVDPESERLIQQALPRVMAGRTSLVVAHRLSTVRRADRILVMSGGRIVEQGRHQELLAVGGLYARLLRLQKAQQEERDGFGT